MTETDHGKSRRTPPLSDTMIRLTKAIASFQESKRECRLVRETLCKIRDLTTEAVGDTTSAPLQTLEDVERDHIRRVLHHTGDNRRAAAAILGIASSTLYEKLKRYDSGAEAQS